MKTLLATLTAALLLGASVAHAKPSKRPKAAFACDLVELTLWTAPDVYYSDTVIAVRLRCHNDSAKTVRVKARDVFLLNTDGQKYRPDRDSDNLDVIYSDDAFGPEHVDHFIDIERDEVKDLGFTFTGGDGLTDPHLTLDVNGTKYEHHRSPEN